MKNWTRTIHKAAALSGFMMILSFFTSTLYVELFGSFAQIASVKTYIFYAIWFLIPTMALAGITGAKMAPKVTIGPIAAKKKRMPLIALNGLLVLTPAAIYLHYLADAGQFNSTFYIVQIIELIAGFTNLILMSMSIRDVMKQKKPARLA
ncbi:hypothetical protein G3U99_18095 [Vibrio coralliilyticus OCN008]|uniref:hypothetical protein n=1 Tax=Vibrio coralliilyticus TaxID=190893 RepID=UPI0003915AED|nr:hypothetical protein [Vibrio coralliilyticus]ERB63887.1 membrane protein [Vibrio coralliilyticus OCN008]QIJ86184.1 hypothetical protein G3U99_18095 [Vibrio coralliilyticus OCN008]